MSPKDFLCLVTGAKGQVGICVTAALTACRFPVEALAHGDLDIADAVKLKDQIASMKPAIIINAAAYTEVDKAQSEPALAFDVNAVGPGYLAEAAQKAGAPLIHISTDYVFDGAKAGPYVECDPIGPLGVYGSSKAEGEARVRDRCEHHIILRTAWVFSPYGQNFVKTMLALGQSKQELRVVADQHGNPTGARDIAMAISGICKMISSTCEIPWGTYHFACRGETTWHGLAEATFDLATKHGAPRPRVIPITADEYPTLAKRPVNSVLNCLAFDQAFNLPRREWHVSLAETVQEVLS